MMTMAMVMTKIRTTTTMVAAMMMAMTTTTMKFVWRGAC